MSSSQPALVPGLQRPARDRGQAGQGDPAGDRRARRRRGGRGSEARPGGGRRRARAATRTPTRRWTAPGARRPRRAPW